MSDLFGAALGTQGPSTAAPTPATPTPAEPKRRASTSERLSLGRETLKQVMKRHAERQDATILTVLKRHGLTPDDLAALPEDQRPFFITEKMPMHRPPGGGTPAPMTAHRIVARDFSWGESYVIVAPSMTNEGLCSFWSRPREMSAWELGRARLHHGPLPEDEG